MQAVTPLDRLLAQEGWQDVTPASPAARPDAPVRVHVSKQRGKKMMLTISIAPDLVSKLGAPPRVNVRFNSAEQAIVIEPGADGFAPFALSAFSRGKRRTVRVAAFKNMTVESLPEPAEGSVITWKGKPALVVRLPAHLFMPLLTKR